MRGDVCCCRLAKVGIQLAVIKSVSPAARASYFLCWHKESNQRKCLPRSERGSGERGDCCGFSDETSLSRQKTAGIHAGRPTGLATFRKSLFFLSSRAQRGMTRCLGRCFRSSTQHASLHRIQTRRAAHRMCAVFRPSPRMASRKIPAISPVAV